MPVAGICLLAYLISKKDGKLLVARIAGDRFADFWQKEWGMYTQNRLSWEYKWFVPSGFLKFGESPANCADRLLHRLLIADASLVQLSNAVSFTMESREHPHYHHWHLCFVYDVKDLKLNKHKPFWFDALEYVDISKINFDNLAAEGGEVMKQLFSQG